MTPEEIRQLSDSDLTCLVVKKVMGIKLTQSNWWIGHMDGHNEDKVAFSPLTNANHRDMVVERMRELGWYVFITDEPSHFPHSEEGQLGDWSCEFSGKPREVYESVHKNLSRAVLEAALMAVRGK